MIGDIAHTEQLAAVARPTSALEISSRQRADMIAFIPPPPYSFGHAAHW
jgi:hypothetical protein